MPVIDAIYRFPIKGFSAQRLDAVEITAQQGLPFDRFWAVENGSHDFDPENPRFLPKRRFIQLAENPMLARMKCEFDEAGRKVRLSVGEHQTVSASLAGGAGLGELENFIARFMAEDMRGSPRIVSAENHHFSDIPQKAVSLINLASVREISKALGREIDPLRFRGNILVDELEPWAEQAWTGKNLLVGDQPVFEVFDNTGRCKATHVNLQTGERDTDMLGGLADAFGHTQCGVYMTAIADIHIKPGDRLSVSQK